MTHSPSRDPVEGVGEHGDIREPFLEEIAHALRVFLEESTGETGIQMVRENEDADLRVGHGPVRGQRPVPRRCDSAASGCRR